MESLQFLLSLAIILLFTKALGLITRKFQLPQVVGALLAGLLLGPAALNLIQETEFIHKIAEIGVIILMFGAGVETDLSELKKSGKPSFFIALSGVIFPIIGGFGIATLFSLYKGIPFEQEFLQNLFVGIILSATSVSITVETLKEMGKLSSKTGNTILSAAIIDDIIGMIALTVITSTADTSVNIYFVLLKIVGFFFFVIAIGLIFHKSLNKWVTFYQKDMRRFIIASFVFCLLMSYSSEVIFGVANVTGAYFAGLIISSTKIKEYAAKRFDILSYMIFSPVFFASIGLKVIIPSISLNLIIFSGSLIIVAILFKIVGCGLTARLCGYNKKDALRIGVGMIARGEVALIITNKGVSLGIISPDLFTPIVMLVIISSIIAPILLKKVFQEKGSHEIKNELI